MDLSVIIVSYNVKAYLEQALRSILKALEGIDAEILVVDNGSGDGSPTVIRQRFPQVQLIENKENAGFARANNQALRIARGRAVCLINPDTIVQEDTFRICLAYLDAHDCVGAVGCKILNADGTLQLACRRSFPTPAVALAKVTGLARLFPRSRIFGRYNLTYLDPDDTAEVEALSGSFMMVRRATISQVGLLDEDFFLYGEDLDWCYRIRQSGWSIVYLPDTQMVHFKGRSTLEAPFDSLRVFYSAMALFVRKHFNKGWAFLPRWFLLAGIGLRASLSYAGWLSRRLSVPLIDLGCLQIGLILALVFRFGHLSFWGNYSVVNGAYSVIWLGCLGSMGLYRPGVFSTSRALAAAGLGLVVNASVTFFLPQYAFSRQVVLAAGGVNAILLGGWRLAVRVASHMTRIPFVGNIGKTLVRRRVLIVGCDQAARLLAEKLNDRIDGTCEVIGLVGIEEQDLMQKCDDPVHVLGVFSDLKRLIVTYRIHEVIFSPESVSYEKALSIVASNQDLRIDFKMAPRETDVLMGQTDLDALGDMPLIDLAYRIRAGVNPLIKRLMDLIVSVLVLPIWAPSLLFLAMHPRIRFHRIGIADGLGGELGVWEVRKSGQQIGGWFGLAPYFWTVLTGKMSLVGTLRTVSYPVQNYRYKPGLTSLAEVSRRKGLDPKEINRYTLYYLKNYTPLLDVEILLKAVFRF